MVLAKAEQLARGTAVTTAKICTVCIVGANAEVSSRVAALLENQRERFVAHWELADHASADLLLVDAESVYGHMDWLRAKASGRLVAACSASPQAHAGELCLPKPILAGNLVNLLNQVGAKLSAIAPEKVAIERSRVAPPAIEPTAAAPVAVKRAPPERAPLERAPVERVAIERAPLAAAANEPAALELAAIELVPIEPVVDEPAVEARSMRLKSVATESLVPALPAKAVPLIELIKDAAPTNRLRLVAAGLPTLLLDPAQRSWRAEGNLKALAGWCKRSIAPEEIQRPNAAEFDTEAAALPAQPYVRLRWLAHLLRGEGQLDAGLDPQSRYKLSRWPQSEREFPKHFRIATVMLKQLAKADEIATQSGAALADVVDFINAYHAIGYIEVEAAVLAQEDARRGLFGRMRRSSAN